MLSLMRLGLWLLFWHALRNHGAQWTGNAPTGFYVGTPAESYLFDTSLATALWTFLVNERARSVLDLGSGPGNYIGGIAALGIDVVGVDGNPQLFRKTARRSKQEDLPESLIAARTMARSLVRRGDLAGKLPLNDRRFDWVLSLEVAEHIPKRFEADYLLNIHRSNTYGVILSWAKRRYPGDGHVNTRDETEVSALFGALGYVVDRTASQFLRQAGNYPWFKENIFVFRRRSCCREPGMRTVIRSLSAAAGDDSVDLSKALATSSTTACCSNRSSMEYLVMVSHFQACVSTSFGQFWGSIGGEFNYKECCEPEHRQHFQGSERGSIFCFDNMTGFTYAECCHEVFKSWIS